MRLSPGAPELVASLDGALVAMSAPGRLHLYSADGNELASAELPDGETDLGFVDGQLLCLVRAAGTQLFTFTLPSLEIVAQLELEERLRLVACVGMRALVANESLEQPRIITITTVLVLEPLPLREPLILAAPAPEERFLIASRGRDQQLECWDPATRRALFRLNLPLPAAAQWAGFAARRRLLWILSGGADAQLELYRFSDGRLQARADLGGHVLGAAGHPDSPRLVVAVKPREGEVELTSLDFSAGDRYELTPPLTPVALCVAESATPSLVLHAGGSAAPLFVPLPRVLPAEGEHRPPAPVLSRTTRTAPSVSTLGRAHARPPTPLPLPHADLRPLQAPSRVPPAAKATPPHAPAPVTPRALDDDGDAPPYSREGTWRDRLCAWCKRLLADPADRLELPDGDDASPLADVVERLDLDRRATRVLALLYAARLLGEASLPAAICARALANGAPPTDDDWDEALGRGLAARLGLVRAREGRLRLRPLVGRFLDGAAPRLTILPAGDGALAPPDGPALHDAGEHGLEHAAAELAARFGCPVALVPLPPADARSLVERALLEARLHGAWPLFAGADPAAWIDVVQRVPSVILVRGTPPPSLAHLPRV